jgi:hypothetical protein
MYDPRGLYVDPYLTDFSVGYAETQDYFGTRILPITSVRTQSGKYRVFDRSAWLIYEDRREPGTVANEIQGAKWSEDTFKTVEHSLQAPVYDEEDEALASLGGFNSADEGVNLDFDPEEDATETVTEAILRKHEKKAADLVRNAANYPVGHTVTLAGAQQWDDYSGTSAPLTDIRIAIRKIKKATGRNPNLLALPEGAVVYLENHPDVVDRFKNFALTIPEAFRILTGFEGEIIILDSWYNQANHIDDSEDIVSFWGQDAWLGVVDSSPGQRTKTFGKTFQFPYANGGDRPTERWYEVQRKTTVVRNSWRYDVKIVSNIAGYLLKDVIATTA